NGTTSLSVIANANNDPTSLNYIRGLPPESASISVIAGLNGQQPAYDAFAAAYLDPSRVAEMPDYLKTTLADGTVVPIYLTSNPPLSPSDSWSTFQALPELVQHQILRDIFMLELRDAGRNQNTLDSANRPLNGGYNRGYKAIATLFPGDAWNGSVKAH